LLASVVRENGWWEDRKCGRLTCAVPLEVMMRLLSHALGRQADMHTFREGSVKTIALSRSRLLVNVLVEGVVTSSSSRKGSHPTTDMTVRTEKPLFKLVDSQVSNRSE
jgi:hypothetical protein